MTSLEKVTFMLGDASKLDLPSNSVDLVITHPPHFGVDTVRYGGDPNKQINATKDSKRMVKSLFKAVKEIERVLKPTGSLILANGSRGHVDARLFVQIIDNTKLTYVDRVVQNSYSCKEEMDYTDYEVITSNCLTTWNHFAFPQGFYSNPFAVRKYNNPGWDLRFNNLGSPIDLELAKNHQVMDAMNREVPRRFIEMFSKKGDVVLDPFGGSGVVAVTAAELGRKGISNDISDDQVTVAKERFKLTFGE
jgi:site-specific DNA-methyltransferase (adenine-specific)